MNNGEIILPSVDACRAYEKWQKRLTEQLPGLCARVFALRTKTYHGNGFNHIVEHALGHVISAANDRSHIVSAKTMVGRKTMADKLFARVVSIEREIVRSSTTNPRGSDESTVAPN